ncbi:MAG: SGNH/GDSL hydrolase family protein [Candidatus Nanopelagicales bacterium]|nr:SGNH/GDSL hydrolase family protein [Candidatus Nanopelagicales bacterium]
MAYRDRVISTRWGLAVALLAVTIFAAPPAAHAAQTPKAVGTWSMVPQSKDANGDGFIDGDGGVPTSGALSLQPSSTYKGAGNFIAQPNERLISGSLSWYLDADGFPVSLNACKSVGDSYTWTIQRGGETVITTPIKKLTTKTCRQSVRLPEGLHSLKLTVRSGVKVKRVSMVANVSNILMVVMGDSYASGEGNPRNVAAWLKNTTARFTPYWDNDQCNRSVHGAPAQAALRLEKSSAKTSVTLVDVSCSGATVDRGILGAQYASAGSQVEQVSQLIGNRSIDVLSLTIGGNDVGFGSILTTCAVASNCPLAKATTSPLSKYAQVQTGVQTLTAQLPAAYASINSCLAGTPCTTPRGGTLPGLTLSPDGAVFLNSYPDITRGANGDICSYLTITREDFQWARDTILEPAPANPFAYTTTRSQQVSLDTAAGSLNGQINATGSLGWQPVMGVWGASGDSTTGHGVCAGSDAWVFGLTGLTGFNSGSFHPNPDGLTAMSQQIFTQIKATGF